MTTAGTVTDDRTHGMEAQPVQIKRYPNRRFYDRGRRRYVTLQEIEDLVRHGQTINVRDSKSDEDLTRVVLTQILIERHPDRMEMFPIAMLHMMLRANDMAFEFLKLFLRMSVATLETFQNTRPLPTMATPFDWMRLFFPGFAPPLLRFARSDPICRRRRNRRHSLRSTSSPAGSRSSKAGFDSSRPKRPWPPHPDPKDSVAKVNLRDRSENSRTKKNNRHPLSASLPHREGSSY